MQPQAKEAGMDEDEEDEDIEIDLETPEGVKIIEKEFNKIYEKDE